MKVHVHVPCTCVVSCFDVGDHKHFMYVDVPSLLVIWPGAYECHE